MTIYDRPLFLIGIYTLAFSLGLFIGHDAWTSIINVIFPFLSRFESSKFVLGFIVFIVINGLAMLYLSTNDSEITKKRKVLQDL